MWKVLRGQPSAAAICIPTMAVQVPVFMCGAQSLCPWDLRPLFGYVCTCIAEWAIVEAYIGMHPGCCPHLLPACRRPQAQSRTTS